MNGVSKALALVVLPILLSGCNGHPELQRSEDYRSYIFDEDHGLCSEQKAGEILFKIQYKPSELIALEECPKDTLCAKKRAAELSNTAWFVITLSIADKNINPLKYNVADYNEYNRRVLYYANAAQNDFSISYGSLQSLPIAGYQFENNHGLTQEDKMIIGYRIPDAHPIQPMKVSYLDRIYGSGIINLEISHQELQNIPSSGL